jgi:signal transduction histidine kinase
MVNDDSPRPEPPPAPARDRLRREAADVARLTQEIEQRDDILSLAAHELRNPLHALSLHLALARATAQAGNAAEAALRIRRAEFTLKRYSERVTVLMELLASPAATYPLAPRRIDVAQLLAALVDSLEHEARLRDIEVRLVVEPGVQTLRSVDPVALEQVVDNLLLNAFKHSAARLVTLRLLGDDAMLEVQVMDNGGGIAPEDQLAIFAKFAVATHSRRGAGTGLGLWIVTRLVRAMGGRLDLDSAPGEGSVFKVRIPQHNDMSSSA